MEQININFGGNKKSNRIVRIYESINNAQFDKHKLVLGNAASEAVGDYQWSEEISKIASNLIYYFNGIEGEYDLNKSIAICGTYGVGKTILMKIFQMYMRSMKQIHPNIYRIISIEDVIKYMSEPNALDSELLYNCKTELDRPVRRPANLMINEFGYKYEGKNFGTEYQELIEMFIMKRYDIFQDYNKLTHVTMNLGTAELEEVFDDKIIDRLIEMFNIIPLGGDSYRK